MLCVCFPNLGSHGVPLDYLITSSKVVVFYVMLRLLGASTLFVGRQEGHNWVLVCWWWWFDWNFARLTAPVVTATSILSSIKTD